MVEDLVSTGKSSLQAVDALVQAGLDVVGMVSIFTYDFAVAADAFAARNLKYISLTSYPVLIELAQAKGLVKETDVPLLLEWRQSPATWQGV
ncbi:MAG: hypothetical protein QM727_12405 [Niabella sp.]